MIYQNGSSITSYFVPLKTLPSNANSSIVSVQNPMVKFGVKAESIHYKKSSRVKAAVSLLPTPWFKRWNHVKLAF